MNILERAIAIVGASGLIFSLGELWFDNERIRRLFLGLYTFWRWMIGISLGAVIAIPIALGLFSVVSLEFSLGIIGIPLLFASVALQLSSSKKNALPAYAAIGFVLVIGPFYVFWPEPESAYADEVPDPENPARSVAWVVERTNGSPDESAFSRLVKAAEDDKNAKHANYCKTAIGDYLKLWKIGDKGSPLGRHDAHALAAFAVRQGEPETRERALEAIRTLGKDALHVAPILAAAGKTERSDSLRFQFVAVLHALEVRSNEALDFFESRLNDKDKQVRDRAALALLDLEPSRIGLPLLVDLANSREDELRVCAASVLEKRLADTKPTDLGHLRLALKSRSCEVQIAAIKAIDRLKESGKAVLPELTALISSHEPEVSSQALLTLRNMGMLSEIARKNSNPTILRLTIGEISSTRAKSSEELELYLSLLKNPDSSVKKVAAIAVIESFPERMEILQLCEFMSWDDKQLSAAAGELLRQKLASITFAELPTLREGLKTRSRDAQLAMLYAIGSLDTYAAPAVPDLVAFMSSNDNELGSQAAIAYYRTGELMHLLHTKPSKEVVCSALRGLGSYRANSKDVIAFLDTHLEPVMHL
jgi:HEAT repeat protein